MKITLLLAATAIIASAYTVEKTDNSNNDLAEAHLKGRVKSVATMLDHTSEDQNFDYHKVEVFDEHGNKIADSNFNELNFRPVYHKCQYSQQGAIMEKQQYCAGTDAGWKTTFTYNDAGILSETKTYHTSGKMEQRIVYNYDAQGRNTERLSYAADGHQNGRTVLKYDASGSLTEQSKYSEINGSLSLVSHDTYYANGNSTSEQYNSNHKVERSSAVQQLETDDEGNCIKWREDIKGGGKSFSLFYKREIKYY